MTESFRPSQGQLTLPPQNPVAPRAKPSGAAQFFGRTAEMLRFAGGTIKDLPTVRLYASEVFAQAGVIILSSALVLWFMEFMLGAVLGIETHYLFRQMGAASYVGAVPAIFATRGASETMWGWILSAKVGCGIVAEIGSMRIGEEVDAMEVMGVNSRAYLVGTRVVASIIAMPFLYVVGFLMSFAGAYVMNVVSLKTVSEGGFFAVLWSFQNLTDFVYAVLWAMVVTIVIILVSCFFGYTASGGPVGVGNATAKSMAVNMVLISVLAMAVVQLLYGNNPNAPIAN
ncbi:ABC transporter permease [Amycolatopsis sp. K13G38]|uniref:ABC transporter permease n=1 Tax=Amycolatopsis acididurans TaxID=2724524 RepID=A0ABX1J4I2_9PSEU|nr:ABC transporter permease [Amycolatopsis acididurans]NKQ53212.1 ABC transporter permease [Amycolatopsis acididurans]